MSVRWVVMVTVHRMQAERIRVYRKGSPVRGGIERMGVIVAVGDRYGGVYEF